MSYPPYALAVTDIALRTAGPGDIAELLRFWTGAARGRSVSDDETGVTRLLARDPDAVIVAEVDGRIVGSLIVGWDGWRAHLYRLAVAPEHRRQGIGRTLVAEGERRLRALGARRFEAMVLDDNEDGQAAWRAAGYRPDRAWSRWTRPAAPGPAARP